MAVAHLTQACVGDHSQTTPAPDKGTMDFLCDDRDRLSLYAHKQIASAKETRLQCIFSFACKFGFVSFISVTCIRYSSNKTQYMPR